MKKLKIIIVITICLVYAVKILAEPNQPACLKTIPPEVNKPHKPNELNYPCPAGVNLSEKAGKLQEPIDYVLSKFRDYDLVMIGERHWTHEEPVFIQNLIKRCCEKKAVDFIFLEFGGFENQPKIEAFLKEPQYNPKPVIDTLRNFTEFGWGYQEYFDIFKLVYDENKNRPEKEKIKIVLVDGPPSVSVLTTANCINVSITLPSRKMKNGRK